MVHSKTYREVALEGLIIQSFVLGLDGAEVDLGAAGDDPDEDLVRGAGALHGVAQPRREPGGRILHALHCKTHATLYVP